MNNTIADSLAKIRLIESTEVLNEAAVAAPVAQAASKGIGRYLIPGVGAALGAQDAYSRYKKGDLTGAAISGVGAAASLIPGVGGLVGGLGSAGLNALRDKQRTGSYLPSDDEIAAGVAKDTAAKPAATAAAPVATPAGADPKVLALQKQLIAKGAKITADGKMGPATQAAMKQFPGVAEAEQNKGNDMSESQKIAELRDRLAQLESQPQIADEGIADLAKGVGNFFKGAKAGVQGGSAASNVASGAANLGKAGDKGMAAAQAVKGAGQAVKTAATGNTAKNIAKVGGGAAVGAGAMAALSGGAANKPTVNPSVKPAVTPAAPAQTPNAGADKADVDALNAMAAELENSQDPADIELLRRYNGIINAINNRAPDDKRTQGEIAASADLKDAGV
jgi:peptidoglycan hydrolase-like protein with peptidoglycan-binding domain